MRAIHSNIFDLPNYVKNIAEKKFKNPKKFRRCGPLRKRRETYSSRTVTHWLFTNCQLFVIDDLAKEKKILL